MMDAVLDPTNSAQQQQLPTMGFCMVRPPGHHVKPSRPMGFGLINFIAVAARYALQQPHINKVRRPHQHSLQLKAARPRTWAQPLAACHLTPALTARGSSDLNCRSLPIQLQQQHQALRRRGTCADAHLSLVRLHVCRC